MIEIDGTYGEGGGQILRTTLSLSMITGTPVRMRRIRARRPQPGLRPQHLKCVEAAAAVSRARVEGARLGAQTLSFVPRAVVPGSYRFDIGTAGAACLVLQMLAPALARAGAASSVTVSGGTHVPWSPCFHFLAYHWAECLRGLGWALDFRLERTGFYPKGGGRIRMQVTPSPRLRPLDLIGRGALRRIRGLSVVANLDRAVAERQRQRALSRLAPLQVPVGIRVETVAAYGKGSYLVLFAQFDRARFCVCALGARGKAAEKVADEAVDAVQAFVDSGAAVDARLADQLLLPLALTAGESRFTTEAVTPHLLTNSFVIRQFLDVDIRIAGETGRPGRVTVRPRP